MKRFVKWIFTLPPSIRILVASLCTTVPFYFAAYLALTVAEVAHFQQRYGIAMHAVIYVVLLTIVVFGYRILKFYYDNMLYEKDRILTNLIHVHSLCDRLFVEHYETLSRGSFDEYFYNYSDICLTRIRKVVSLAYTFFESEYGKGFDKNERIDFEVTFMTKSYVDGNITIPAWASRDGRGPRSMILRQQNPEIYNNTETAKVYQMPRPVTIIVEDTEGASHTYAETYPGQKQRIKSTIVYPVLSNTNEMLGTLVVHCDRRCFFRKVDEKRWSDLMEAFSKRIALEKMLIDIIVRAADNEKHVTISCRRPF